MSSDYMCFSATEPPPRSRHFIQVVHTTGSLIHGFKCLAKRSCPTTTIRDLCETLCHSGKTSMYLHSPYVAVQHRKTTESQPYVHSGSHL